MQRCAAFAAVAVVAALVAPLRAELPGLEPPDPLEAPPAAAERDEDGLAWQVLHRGEGTVRPAPADYVKVRYTGWNEQGEVIDSTVPRGGVAIVPLGAALEGWSRGVQGMVQGEVRRIWIPAELAGRSEKTRGPLVFDVELLEIITLPAVPEHLQLPPPDAERARSGLAWKVLGEGGGTRRPRKRSVVVVHYTGWNTAGDMIDSSRLRGQPSRFSLDAVIRGWTEGVQLMVEGEQRRFWIPAKLAYKGQAGKPQGMLIFDVELVRIEKE